MENHLAKLFAPTVLFIVVGAAVGSSFPECEVDLLGFEFDQVPMDDCENNTLETTTPGFNDQCAEVCVPNAQFNCAHCVGYEFESSNGNLLCGSLTPNNPFTISNAADLTAISCFPMRISDGLNRVFATFPGPNDDVDPSTFDGSILGAARSMSTSQYVCAFRDPAKPILSTADLSSTPGANFTGATLDFDEIDAVSNVTFGSVQRLGFNFQQAVACTLAAPSPTPIPTPSNTGSTTSVSILSLLFVTATITTSAF